MSTLCIIRFCYLIIFCFDCLLLFFFLWICVCLFVLICLVFFMDGFSSLIFVSWVSGSTLKKKIPPNPTRVLTLSGFISLVTSQPLASYLVQRVVYTRMLINVQPYACFTSPIFCSTHTILQEEVRPVIWWYFHSQHQHQQPCFFFPLKCMLLLIRVNEWMYNNTPPTHVSLLDLHN